MNDVPPGMTCGVNSRNEQHVQKFCKQVVNGCNVKQLDERIADLTKKTSLSQIDIDELELIDRQLTKILLHADNQCRPLSMAPWSPAVQKAYLAHRFWSLQFTAKRTERNLKTALQKIAQRLDPESMAKDPNRSLSSHLRQAQKQLKQARKDAAEHQKKHLEALFNQATAANQHKKSKALQYLIRA